MVEIDNIPQIEGENTTKIVFKLMDVLKMDLNKNVLDVVHRLSNKPDSPIIMKFTSRTARDAFFSDRSGLKTFTIECLGFSIDLNSKSSRIFINESLSRINKALFKEVRSVCFTKNFQ